MNSKYTKMTKAELIKKITKLESEMKNKAALKDVEELNHQLHLKNVQIENQKFELLDKQMELEISRDKYADLYDFSPTGYITLNSDGLIEDINLKGADMLGVSTKYARIYPLMHFIVKEDLPKYLKFIRNCKNSESNCIEEFTLNNLNNGHIIVQLNALTYQNFKTKKLSFRISVSDITEERKAQKAMQESENRFRLMADASPSMIWMSDMDGKVIYINKTFIDFLCIKDYQDQSLSLAEYVHPDDLPVIRGIYSESIKQQKDFALEFRMQSRNNEYRWLYQKAAPRKLPGGEMQGYIGSMVDITERKNSRLKLEKSLKEKEILLKEIHHRVKNNLQVMSSLLSLQKNYITNKEVLNIFSSSQSRISAMALLHEHLYGSKNLSSINFKDYAKSLLSSLLNTYRDNVRDIRVNLNIAEIELNLDTSINFGLIINELVSNSLKYAFRGKKNGSIDISLSKANSNNLVLKVSDDGIGLPDDFDMKKNNSLGLELVSNIVEQLRGRLEISRNGKTEFRILVSRNLAISSE